MLGRKSLYVYLVFPIVLQCSVATINQESAGTVHPVLIRLAENFKSIFVEKCGNNMISSDDQVMKKKYSIQTENKYHCADKCIVDNLRLFDDNSLNADVVKKLAKKMGADLHMTEDFVRFFKECFRSSPPNVEDKCKKYQNIMDCFWENISLDKWVPVQKHRSQISKQKAGPRRFTKLPHKDRPYKKRIQHTYNKHNHKKRYRLLQLIQNKLANPVTSQKLMSYDTNRLKKSQKVKFKKHNYHNKKKIKNYKYHKLKFGSMKNRREGNLQNVNFKKRLKRIPVLVFSKHGVADQDQELSIDRTSDEMETTKTGNIYEFRSQDDEKFGKYEVLKIIDYLIKLAKETKKNTRNNVKFETVSSLFSDYDQMSQSNNKNVLIFPVYI